MKMAKTENSLRAHEALASIWQMEHPVFRWVAIRVWPQHKEPDYE